jgi:hypothetical protein
MNQTAQGSRESLKASNPHTGAAGVAETPRPTGEQQHREPGRRGSGLLAPLRWLGRRLSGLVRWVAKHLPAPVRWLGRLFAPGRERCFGFWWMVATLSVAVALAMVVALLLTPVAGLIALLVMAIWALGRRRRRRRKRDDRSPRLAHTSELP